jgi:hypothetical protein
MRGDGTECRGRTEPGTARGQRHSPAGRKWSCGKGTSKDLYGIPSETKERGRHGAKPWAIKITSPGARREAPGSEEKKNKRLPQCLAE